MIKNKPISDLTENEILREQLELLAEKSRTCKDSKTLIELSNAMTNVKLAININHC